MAFELKKLLKTLLISTSEPISVRDVQGLIARYHQENAPEHSELEEVGEKQNQVDNKTSVEASPEEQSTAVENKPNEPEEEIEPQIDVPSLVTKAQIEEAMDDIRNELTEAKDVFVLKQGPHGYYLATTPEYSEWVRLLRKEPKPLKLRQAALETLAIIAYRQPVTRAEIEAIRGVSVDSAIAKLVELEFIHVTGRAELPGRPMQYGTTDNFLEFCGIVDLEDLPTSDVIESGQLTEWLKDHTEGTEMSDTDMGLHDDAQLSQEEQNTEVVIEKEEIILKEATDDFDNSEGVNFVTETGSNKDHTE